MSDINLFATNALHFQSKKVCGTQIASNKSVKSMSMFDRPAITCSKNVLDYLSIRQKVVASNVANVNTPGYKTRDVSFSSVLESKNENLRLDLARTHEKHFPKSKGGGLGVEPFYAYKPVKPNDGVNDVDLDKEMLKETEIQANFNIFSKLLSKKYSGIRKVIQGTV